MITTRRKGDSPIVAEAMEIMDETANQGAALLTEVIKEPTLDIYLDRSPKLNTDVDYEQMVTILQRKRAAFITAEQKRKEPKIEGDNPDESEV